MPTIIDFPAVAEATREGFCECAPTASVDRGPFNEVYNAVLRGPQYLWQQELTVVADLALARALSTLRLSLAGGVNIVRAPDFFGSAMFAQEGPPGQTPLYAASFGFPVAENLTASAAATAGATSLAITAPTARGIVMRAGQRFSVADRLYESLADVPVDGNGAGTITFRPGLREDVSQGTVVEVIAPRGRWHLAQTQPRQWMGPETYLFRYEFTEYLQSV